MNNHTRGQIYFYLALVTLGLLFLAASLDQMKYQPGMPIPGAETSQEIFSSSETSDFPAGEIRLWFQLPLTIIFFSLVIVFIIGLIKKVKLKHIFILACSLIAVLCLFLLLNQIKFASPQISGVESQEVVTASSSTYETAPIGNPPAGLFSAVMVALILAAVLFAGWTLYQVTHHQQDWNPLAAKAGQAIEEIHEGGDLENIILRCYMQMETILKQEKGIERADSLTAREFEHLLTLRGIAAQPIHQLINLFEKVRYGHKQLGPEDEITALECLTAIQNSCASLKREK